MHGCDHKLLVATLRQPKSADTGSQAPKTKAGANKLGTPQAKQKSPLILKWNAQNLKDDQARLSYKVNLDSRLKTMNSSIPAGDPWQALKQCIQASASATLNRPTSPITPRRRKACAKLEQAKFRSDRSPTDLNLKIALKQARRGKLLIRPI